MSRRAFTLSNLNGSVKPGTAALFIDVARYSNNNYIFLFNSRVTLKMLIISNNHTMIPVI